MPLTGGISIFLPLGLLFYRGFVEEVIVCNQCEAPRLKEGSPVIPLQAVPQQDDLEVNQRNSVPLAGLPQALFKATIARLPIAALRAIRKIRFGLGPVKMHCAEGVASPFPGERKGGRRERGRTTCGGCSKRCSKRK